MAPAHEPVRQSRAAHGIGLSGAVTGHRAVSVPAPPCGKSTPGLRETLGTHGSLCGLAKGYWERHEGKFLGLVAAGIKREVSGCRQNLVRCLDISRRKVTHLHRVYLHAAKFPALKKGAF